jgi:hypothetical protein
MYESQIIRAEALYSPYIYISGLALPYNTHPSRRLPSLETFLNPKSALNQRHYL